MRLTPITQGIKRAEMLEAQEITSELIGGFAMPFAKGFNSYAYRIGNDVVKIAKKSLPVDRAKRKLSDTYDFYNLLNNYFGEESVAQTDFRLSTDPLQPDRLRLVTHQSYLEGASLADGGQYDPEILLGFYKSALRMYDMTRKIGDIAAIEGGLFDPLKTKNVIINTSGEPILADVDTGKIQGSTLFGPMWSKFISIGVQRGIRQLRAQG